MIMIFCIFAPCKAAYAIHLIIYMRINTAKKFFKSITAYYLQHAATAGVVLLALSTALQAAHLIFDIKSNAILMTSFAMMFIGIMTVVKAARIKG